MFADALERAINSEEPETTSDVPEESWAAHPYYHCLDRYVADRGDADEDTQDTPAYEVDQQESYYPDDGQEIALEAHPYYDAPDEGDLHESEPDDVAPDVAWEDHPYYEAPDEGDLHESEPENDSSYTTEEEEEMAWAASPYY